MKSKLNVFKGYYYPKRMVFKNIKIFFDNFRCAWQRATKGYCYRDLWSLDNFYLELFTNTLRDFKKNLHGAPIDLYDERTDSIVPWEDYIDDLIQHFEDAKEDWEAENKDRVKASIKRTKALDIGMDMFKDRFFDLWD